jgi:hypothetical protein
MTECIECKSTNPDDNRFCGKCGAELGRSVEGTIRVRGFRDRQVAEMEITESVVSRLMKWAAWLGSIFSVILVLFGLLFGLLFGGANRDVHTAVASGEAEINTAVKQGESDVDAVSQKTADLQKQVDQVQLDIDGYRKVNDKIEKLQASLTKVQSDVIDLGAHSLKVARMLEVTGTGPSYWGLESLGCPRPDALVTGVKIALCAQGSPVSFFQLTPAGDVRPLSSLSTIGFQDVSVAMKPSCTAASRGTFYVQKGSGDVADKPFVCVKGSNNSYEWIQLVAVP